MDIMIYYTSDYKELISPNLKKKEYHPPRDPRMEREDEGKGVY